jgi:hypothetical protein
MRDSVNDIFFLGGFFGWKGRIINRLVKRSLLCLITIVAYSFCEGVFAIEGNIGHKVLSSSFDVQPAVADSGVVIRRPGADHRVDAGKLVKDSVTKNTGPLNKGLFSENIDGDKAAHKCRQENKNTAMKVVDIFVHILIGLFITVPMFLCALTDITDPPTNKDNNYS